MRTVMIFGVFDGIHDGHRYFFQEAKKFGDCLIAVVAKNHLVQQLKGRPPKASLIERRKELEKEKIIDMGIVSDDELGAWDVLKTHRPDVVALGYDQQALKEDLEAHRSDFGWQFEIKIIDAYQPDKYHNTSLSNT